LIDQFKNNLLSETKINYWFKHLLNCNISAILVAATTNTTSATSYSRKAEEIHRSSIQQQQDGRFC